jgi:hypothetical protein
MSMPPEDESSAQSGDGTVKDQIEGSVEFWIRAYPRRWREARGEDFLGLVVDLAGPDAHRLDARAAFDLVRGGLATRLREHPPLHTWLLYRVFDRRIPLPYRSWARDDIDGFLYPSRRMLLGLLIIWLVTSVMSVVNPSPIPGANPAFPGPHPALSFTILALMLIIPLFMWPEAWGRNSARLRHLGARPGEPYVSGTLVGAEVSRERATARSMLTWSVLLLGIAGAASIIAALLASRVLLVSHMPDHAISAQFDVVAAGGHRLAIVGMLMVALGFGVLGATGIRRRLRRLVGERPEQPARVLHPVRGTSKASVLFWALIVVALAWLEVSGRLALALSVTPGVVALLLLPGALVALAVARRTDAPDLAGSDVWWIGTRGRLPAVDLPIHQLRLVPILRSLPRTG